MAADPTPDRRKFKRLNAPVFCRPLGRTLASEEEAKKHRVQDISLGGLRVYTDDRHANDERLELELWLPDGQSITLDTRVVWVEQLPKGGPARFEVGLRFVDVAAADLALLQGVLKEP